MKRKAAASNARVGQLEAELKRIKKRLGDFAPLMQDIAHMATTFLQNQEKVDVPPPAAATTLAEARQKSLNHLCHSMGSSFSPTAPRLPAEHCFCSSFDCVNTACDRNFTPTIRGALGRYGLNASFTNFRPCSEFKETTK